MNPRLSRLFATRIDTQSDKGQLIFEPGQIWQIQSGEFAGLEALIVKTDEETSVGTVVHVTIRGPIFTRSGFELQNIPHLPFLKSGLEASDLRYRGHLDEIPDDWKAMYQEWLDDPDEDESSVFSLPVGEVLTEIMNRLPV